MSNLDFIRRITRRPLPGGQDDDDSSSHSSSSSGSSSDDEHDRGQHAGLGPEASAAAALRTSIHELIGRLRKDFAAAQRQQAARELAATRSVIEAAHSAEQVELAGRPALPIRQTALSGGAGEAERPPDMLPLRARISVRMQQGGQQQAVAAVMPSVPLLPAYKSWAFLPANERALHTGLRMFYIDATGETVPASDSDEETRGDAALDGPMREREEFVIEDIARRHGITSVVVAVTAAKLGSTAAATEARMRRLRLPYQPEADAAPDAGSEAPGAALARLFCRRCRIFNCMTHIGEQAPWPHRRPPPLPPPPAAAAPCSEQCYRLADPSAPLLGPPLAAVAAAAVADGGQPRRRRGKVKRRKLAMGQAAEVPTDSDADSSSEAEEAAAARAAAGRDGSAGASGSGSDLIAAGNGSLLAGLAPSVLLSSAPRQPGAAVHQPAAAAAAAAGSAAGGAAAEQLWEGWTAFERRAVEKGIQMFGWDACRIARLTGDPCGTIRWQLLQLGGVPIGPEAAAAAAVAAGAGRLDRRKASHPTRRKNHSQVATARMKHDIREPWPSYTPCNCPGKCGADCPCLGSKNWCEKFCACGPSCAIRFQGCDCKATSSRCATKRCPCFAAGRECDPDLCGMCAGTCDGSAAGEKTCGNMRLRLGQHKRLAMGLSRVAGWGAFLHGPAQKDQLLGEYTGELITQAEADRRGKVYDRDDNSYLFNLNREWVLDARQRGNKLRFANHSRDPNCNAKILLVDGDHRVGIFARKDLPAGSELMYNYRYEEASAPRWCKHFQDLNPGR